MITFGLAQGRRTHSLEAIFSQSDDAVGEVAVYRQYLVVYQYHESTPSAKLLEQPIQYENFHMLAHPPFIRDVPTRADFWARKNFC